MALFKVRKIIDSNTIEVDGWEWKPSNGKSYSGKIVKIQGYEFSDARSNELAVNILKLLVLDKDVELKGVVKADKVAEDSDVVYCSVYLNDVDISTYFPEITRQT